MIGTKSMFFLFPVAISVTTLLAGWWYGFLATLFSTVAVLFFFVEPRFTLYTAHTEEWTRLAVFTFSGVSAMVAAAWALRRHNNHLMSVL